MTATAEFPKKASRFVAYYRVSTAQQGKSGLGLEAQKKAVCDWLLTCRGELVAEFTEIESGSIADRPELDLALKECRRRRATLVIARLDRLARSVHFISGLMERGIPFIAVEFPEATPLMLHIHAAMAEHERRLISTRTKAGLERAKARGIKLGVNGRALAQNNRDAADAYARTLLPILSELRAAGAAGIRQMTRELNDRGVTTQRGGKWHPQTTRMLLRRIEEL